MFLRLQGRPDNSYCMEYCGYGGHIHHDYCSGHGGLIQLARSILLDHNTDRDCLKQFVQIEALRFWNLINPHLSFQWRTESIRTQFTELRQSSRSNTPELLCWAPTSAVALQRFCRLSVMSCLRVPHGQRPFTTSLRPCLSCSYASILISPCL